MIKSKLRISLLILALLSAWGLLNSCSTKKNSMSRRVYHNLTAHYNAYFNGKEALKDGKNQLRRISQDNYNKILPVFNYGTKENTQSISPSMDRAISKGGMVIDRHSIFIKNVEHIRWIDDAYLLIAKANFYKKEYKTSLRTLDYIVKQYKEPNLKNEAYLWMAKNHMQLKDYDAAESLLDELQNKIRKGQIDKSFRRDLALTYAEFYINQENYPPAEEYLIQTLEYHHPKSQKARLYFILGQINQRRGDLVRATKNYNRVIRMNPDYELAFNARINIAKCFESSSGSSKEIVKSLKKMLKDEKNKDYHDQIYFALAEISEKEGDTSSAKDYLVKSVASSVSNKYQKGIASLKVANILFREPAYEQSQAYYDTAVQSLSSDYPDLSSVKRRMSVLTDLVLNLKMLETEDSLQKIAKMPEAERLKFVDGLIKKIKEDEERKKKEMTSSGSSMGSSLLYRNRQGSQVDAMGNISGSGTNWYFFNPSTVSFGFTEFQKKWGKRKLEDNWRLSNKEPVNEFIGDMGTLVDSLAVDSLQSVTNDPTDRKTYLQNLPLTEAQMDRSDNRIKSALYNLGTIYYQGLSDYPKSEESFESLLKRYPKDTVNYLKACYSLFEMYQELGEKSKSDHYKNLILSKFPESDFAKIIRDPEYKKELLARKNRASDIYKTAYDAYKKGQYDLVIKKYDEAKPWLEDKVLKGKFDFIRTVSWGKTQNRDSLASGLTRFIAKTQSADLKQLAQQILDKLNGKDTLNLGSEEEKKLAKVGYTDDPEAIHLFVVLADIKKMNINAVKLRISDFNIKYYSLEKFSTNSLYLDDTRQLITVSNFQSKEKALDYMNGIMSNNYVFTNIPPGDFQVFVISVGNYPVFYQKRDVQGYLEFFKSHYQ